MSSAVEQPRERSAVSLRSGMPWVRSASGGYISMNRHGEHERAVEQCTGTAADTMLALASTMFAFTLPVARHASRREQVG